MVRLQVRKKKSPSINVGVYEEFPAPEDALEWRKTAAEGSILSKSLNNIPAIIYKL
ncbi:MAG: hypothetical protein Q8N79_10195 [Candidatus Methanoperedens sp.]|nr:hypothetical protein [Candidatus Methanoperedens sp.]